MRWLCHEFMTFTVYHIFNHTYVSQKPYYSFLKEYFLMRLGLVLNVFQTELLLTLNLLKFLKWTCSHSIFRTVNCQFLGYQVVNLKLASQLANTEPGKTAWICRLAGLCTLWQRVNHFQFTSRVKGYFKGSSKVLPDIL